MPFIQKNVLITKNQLDVEDFCQKIRIRWWKQSLAGLVSVSPVRHSSGFYCNLLVKLGPETSSQLKHCDSISIWNTKSQNDNQQQTQQLTAVQTKTSAKEPVLYWEAVCSIKLSRLIRPPSDYITFKPRLQKLMFSLKPFNNQSDLTPNSYMVFRFQVC